MLMFLSILTAFFVLILFLEAPMYFIIPFEVRLKYKWRYIPLATYAILYLELRDSKVKRL